jgi:hypothetical protein
LLNQIIFYNILGIPLAAFGGIITLLCLLFTASIAVMNRRGIHKIPMEWHFAMAKVTVALALIHGILGLLAFL